MEKRNINPLLNKASLLLWFLFGQFSIVAQTRYIQNELLFNSFVNDTSNQSSFSSVLLKNKNFSNGVPFKNLDQDEFTLTFLPSSQIGITSKSNSITYGLTQLLSFQKDKFYIIQGYNFSILNNANLERKYLDSLKAVPGIGRIIERKDNSVLYQNLDLRIGYDINKIFNLEIGNGKHFIGDGYRSLLLSDFGPNYPFAKIVSKFWRLKYTNLYVSLWDNSSENGYKKQRKFASIHHLNLKITKKLSFSIFESIIWRAKDGIIKRGFDPNYLNPIIYYRPVEYSIGSPDNAIVGFDFNYQPLNRLKLYGQFVLDEFLSSAIKNDIAKLRGKNPSQYGWWANKYGMQIGSKYQFKLNQLNLSILTEFQQVRPFTYSHNNSLESYGNLNHALAHPYGSNFREWVTLATFSKGNISGMLKYINATKSLDYARTNYGSDIFKSYRSRVSEYGNVIGQGRQYKLNSLEARIAYIILPQWNFQAFAGAYLVSTTLSNSNANIFEGNYIYLGIKSNLYNLYFDY